MKVKSHAPDFQPREVICSCKAVLEIEFSDLKKRHHEGDPRDQRERSWDQIFVECPDCKTRIDIKDVPEHMAQRIPTQS